MDRNRLASSILAVLLSLGFALAGVACMAKSKSQTDKSAEAESSGADIAATVGDKTFTMEQVDELASKNNAQLYQQLYTARRSALDEMIDDYLIEQEAKSRGIGTSELIAQEVTLKISPVSEDEINAFYEQNKARMGGRTVEQMHDQIQNFLQSRKEADTRQALIDSLRAKQTVKIALSVPRTQVQIAANDPRMGPDSAPVKIIEFSDFQ